MTLPYLFNVYSDDELVFLGRDFCSDLARGVSLESLYGTAEEVAHWVTEPTEVAVISEGGLGIEYSAAIDVWCPEYRRAFDSFVAEVIGIVESRSTTTTVGPTADEVLDLAVQVHPVLGAYELGDLYEVAEAVCDEFGRGASWDTVAVALYVASPADWDEEVVGYFMAYAIRRHCPVHDWML